MQFNKKRKTMKIMNSMGYKLVLKKWKLDWMEFRMKHKIDFSKKMFVF